MREISITRAWPKKNLPLNSQNTPLHARKPALELYATHIVVSSYRNTDVWLEVNNRKSKEEATLPLF
jgi:hypothetical protein